jgi:hypothetical protein
MFLGCIAPKADRTNPLYFCRDLILGHSLEGRDRHSLKHSDEALCQAMA